MTLVCPIRDQPGVSANYAQVQLRMSPKLQDKGSGTAPWLSTYYVPSLRAGILPPVAPQGNIIGPIFLTRKAEPQRGSHS